MWVRSHQICRDRLKEVCATCESSDHEQVGWSDLYYSWTIQSLPCGDIDLAIDNLRIVKWGSNFSFP
jgi:hypothetical protein